MKEQSTELGNQALAEGIKKFLLSRGHYADMDPNVVQKIGNFILAMISTEPTVPLKGKASNELSKKQWQLFKSSEYEGTEDGEFLGHWLSQKAYFIFSRRTVRLPRGRDLTAPSAIHKTLAHLCQERPDPVISYDLFRPSVPRSVKNMRGSMKYVSYTSLEDPFMFENSNEPLDGLWVHTGPLNLFRSLPAEDVHIRNNPGKGRRGGYVAVYTRWFGLYLVAE